MSVQGHVLFWAVCTNRRMVWHWACRVSSIYFIIKNGCCHHLTALFWSLHNSRVSGMMDMSGWMKICAHCNLSFWVAGCVCLCTVCTHLLHYCGTHGRSQASSGMSSILFHKRLLIYGHLPPFCSVALRPLPEQFSPPSTPQLSLPLLPSHTHIHTPTHVG